MPEAQKEKIKKSSGVTFSIHRKVKSTLESGPESLEEAKNKEGGEKGDIVTPTGWKLIQQSILDDKSSNNVNLKELLR